MLGAGLDSYDPDIDRSYYIHDGFSVRCLRDAD